jgi:hypothetical protein
VTPTAKLEAVFARSARIVARRVGRDRVLVPLVARCRDVRALYSLNPVAAFIWDQMNGRRRGRAIVQALVARFDVEGARAARDYRALVGELLAIGAIQPVP